MMIAARWSMLAVASMLMLAAFGATATDLQPSALRVAVTAVIGLIATLFWPGSAATPARTAFRIGAWSAAAACLAAIALRIAGNSGQPFARILAACGMLLLILLVTHAVAAGLEWRWRDQSEDAESAREMAGRAAALALAFVGSLPLWLGPAAELLAGRHPWIIDAVVGMSPLTHLAVASGNDLLRNQWFYQHSNLAALQFSYPSPAELILAYGSVCLALALIALASRGPRSRIDGASPTQPTTEQAI
ncbi:MAG: hypothetical protein ABI886_11170 [Betaproteobacteria bacterium]